MTKGYKVDQKTAIELLTSGEAVALPTETVYGLAADATNAIAIAKVYALKNRPSFNPLICHVASLAHAKQLVRLDATALAMAKAFWPGPLTLVLPQIAPGAVDPLASAGLKSLAVRVPDHPDLQAILKHFPSGLVAPSANRSGSLSPVEARHVWTSLGLDVPVLEAGRTKYGLESTIIACLGDMPPVLLREGAISHERLGRVNSDLIKEDNMDTGGILTASKPISPGQTLRHYAPAARLRLEAKSPQSNEVYLGFGPGPETLWNLSRSGDLTEAAANMFAMLHTMDEQGIDRIAVAPIPQMGLGRAINDRLRRAALGQLVQ